MKVVIIDECNTACELRIRRAAIDSLETSFPGLIERVSFTGKDELNGPAESIQETRESVLVIEYQIRALVVCEPSCKSNSKGGRIQQHPMGSELCSTGLLLNPSIAGMFTDICQKMNSQGLTYLP